MAAARAGLIARGELLSIGTILLLGAGALHLFGPELFLGAQRFVENSLALPTRTDVLSAAKQTLLSGGHFLGIVLGFALAVTIAVNAAVTLGQLAGAGRTAVPIPGFRPSPTATSVIAAFGAGVLALAVMLAGRDILAALGASPENRTERILSASTTLLGTTGAVFSLTGAAQLLYERTAIWKALHLSAAQQKRESRDADGDPRSKAALRRRHARGRT